MAAMMVFRVRFYRHQPKGAMCRCGYTVGTGCFPRCFQRSKAVDVPIKVVGQRSKQGSVRQDRTPFFAAPLRGVFQALYGRALCGNLCFFGAPCCRTGRDKQKEHQGSKYC
jgi:hypothetical protein